ncbi:MAG: hypothetical protein ABI690_13460 [Chloroflexota bacterium]
MYNKLQEEFILEGKLFPSEACIHFDYRYKTIKRSSEVHIKRDTVEIKFKRGLEKDVPFAVRYAVLNVAAVLDGQLLISGQSVQSHFVHSALRRGEGEAIFSTCESKIREISQDQLSTGISLGQIAEVIVPLAHALRDYRLAHILPREEGAVFLWRCLESILWFMADEKTKSAESAIKSVAAKLNVDPALFTFVREQVNHQQKFARHASRRYYDRLAFLRMVSQHETPVLFTEAIASNDDQTVDVYPVSFDDDEWLRMLKSTWQIITRFVPYLAPYIVGHVIFPPWK